VKSLTELRAANIWRELSQPPYILACDAELVGRHNAKPLDEVYRVEKGLVPVPFLGSPDAPIWLLNLNPGAPKGDANDSAETVNNQLANLRLEAPDFWYLGDAFSSTSGYRWWNSKLGSLIRRYGRDVVRRAFFCVEVFPYRSRRFNFPQLLPSQQFTADLVRFGCSVQKVFVVMRAEKNWLKLVPELEMATRVHLKSPQGAWLTENNMREFEPVRTVLESLG
jgi:hypothetical protein